MIALLLVGILALIFVTAALAPMESLGWWAGWSGKRPERAELDETAAEAQEETAAPEADFYLVYLSGIGAISGTSVPDEEYPFIHGLEQMLPDANVLSDIYPYSVTNTGLTSQRAFAGLWRWVEKLRLKNPNSALAMIVNMRNVFQLFVSADRRYGPIFNLGVANEIQRGLLRHGYRMDGGKPIVLLGWSGGGQIALGAVSFLAALPSPVYVISVGGMLSDDVGLDHVSHLWHLYGTADPLQAMGGVLFAGRWTIMPQSPWNRAMAGGKIDIIPLGPYAHNGKGNYFDMETRLEHDRLDRTYGQKTLDTIARILTEEGLLPSTKTGAVAAVVEPSPLLHGGTHPDLPGTATLTISDELLIRLEDLAEQRGLQSVEQLLEEWERADAEASAHDAGKSQEGGAEG